MTKTRNQTKSQPESGRPSGSDSETTNASDQGQGGCCNAPVRKLIDKYSTPRKGNGRAPTTPASTARKMGPPSSAARSIARPGPTSALRMNIDNRQMQNNSKDSSPIEVFCRIKPLDNDPKSCIQILDDTNLALIPPETSNAYKQGIAKESHYAFQRVYGSDAAQKRIFDDIGLPLVRDFLHGKNALLFAYGVTGSGKTYTMSGNATDSGVMPRCLDVIFNSISKYQASKHIFKPDRLNGFETQLKADAMNDRQKEMHEKLRETAKTPRRTGRVPSIEDELEHYNNRDPDNTTVTIKNEDSLYSVFVTYIEVYNNSVYDLLEDSMTSSVKILRDDGNHMYVNGVTEVEVESPEDAFRVYLKGQNRRRKADTVLNLKSSRSHSIFNIRLVQAPCDSEGEEVTNDNKLIHVSQLSLVDLAGSERLKRTKAMGDRLKEAGNINNSLMTLKKCMDLLRSNQKGSTNCVIPFRDSKLTHFLKSYFEGEGRVRMILCLNPKNDDYDENLHVMEFAELTQQVQIVKPQEKKLDPMTPHRRKANEMYKEAKRHLVEKKIIEDYQLPSSDVQMVFGLGIPIPLCKMSKSTEEEMLSTLRKALELRVKGKEELANYIAEKRQSFRLRLMGIEREMETLRSENMTFRSHVERINSEKERLDTVLRATLFEKGEMEVKYKEQEKQIRALEEELLSCKMTIRQQNLAHHKEKETLKEDMDLQRELDAYKQERTLNQEKAKLQAEYRTKEKAIEAVRELVNGIDPQTGRSRSRTSRSTAQVNLSTTSSESDIPIASSRSEQKVTRSKFRSTPVLHESVHVQVNPPSANRRNAIVGSNPKFGRARSTDRDLWVEQTDRAVVLKTQTVFQPVMKKKKSVSKLNSADDIRGASKYCLHTQEQDSDGDIQTKLYKGEINPTITGGANVVFKDVECLKQLSPIATGSPSRKRSSNSPIPHRTRRSRGMGIGDEADVVTYNELEERCRQGISNREFNTSSRHIHKDNE